VYKEPFQLFIRPFCILDREKLLANVEKKTPKAFAWRLVKKQPRRDCHLPVNESAFSIERNWKRHIRPQLVELWFEPKSFFREWPFACGIKVQDS